MPGRSTKAGTRLALRANAAFAAAPTHQRGAILKNFVGWAYAHKHDVPRTVEEIDALSLVFETLLNDGRVEDWLNEFFRLRRARRERHAWRARLWWRIYKVMQRTLPMKQAGVAQ